MTKAIIFDLGGVILNLNFDLTLQAFKKLGADYFDSFFSKDGQSEIFDNYETGLLSCEEFRYHLKNLLGIPPRVSVQEFDAAWNAMLLDLPKARLDFILEMKNKGYQTFLLSNTNGIHLKRVKEIAKTVQVDSFSPYFQREYYSHLVGMRKPEPDIFLKVLNDHHLIATETLFVDDSQQNIMTAKKIGINTFQVSKKNQIFDIIKVLV